MSANEFKKQIETMLESADVLIGGSRPWDIQVKNNELYKRVMAQGSLGFGEAYMDGWWDCEALDQLIDRLLRSKLDENFKTVVLVIAALKAKLMNRQSIKRAYQVGEQHYNAGNDLYRLMLDERMIYSCAYWKNAGNLNEAQEHKLDLTCRKLRLEERAESSRYRLWLGRNSQVYG